ncbi:phage head morphogenesis protein (plasmid) [Skermanella rosea]|uniref:phage minor head protein n=1 Tax=Skermanella rosea TaxID=1817965 RepID=UPI00193308CA|nr:phage minor head protein [Skermanella rosea]UEM08074.1 phage head morphogenesis protein [Skermanella rosea]
MKTKKSLNKAHSEQQVRNEALLVRSEIGLARAIKNARTAFVEQCAEAFEFQGVRSFDAEAMVFRITLRLLFAAQAKLIIPLFGRLTREDIRGLAEKAIDDGFFTALIDRWLAEYGMAHVQAIAETAQGDVLKAVTAGVVAGEGTEAIARRIRKVSALSAWRAATIARTETHQAALFAQAETARRAEQEYGLQLVKVWLPTLDSRTRDAHAAMARHPAIPLNEKFRVGGELMDRPGDPAGSAHNTVNCRCTLVMREAPTE